MNVETIILLTIAGTAIAGAIINGLNLMMYSASYYGKHPHLLHIPYRGLCRLKGDEQPDDYDDYLTRYWTQFFITVFLVITLFICIIRIG